MSDEEDSDWYDILFHPTQYRSWHRIFDYILHFLKSAEWDAAVMGFIDNNCAVFVNDEENKFEYSQIHRAFVDEIEALIDAQLDKVGISNDLLVAACKHARHNREINREVPLIACTIAKQVISMQVYEQMIAMDDFLTFKKLMVKRNVELGYEALKALHKDQVPIIAPESEEEAEAQFQRAVKESEDTTFAEIKESETESQINSSVKGHLFDKELCDAMDQNLMEIEALHKREEIEQLELEQVFGMLLIWPPKYCLQAIAESLATEKERMKALRNEIEADASPNQRDEPCEYNSDYTCNKCESTRKSPVPSDEVVGLSIVAESKLSEIVSPRPSLNAPIERFHASLQDKCVRQPYDVLIYTKLDRIGSSGDNRMKAKQIQIEMHEKRRRVAEAAFNRNQEILRERRLQEREIQGQAGVTAADMLRRELRLKEQRDRIIAKKNAERQQRLTKGSQDTHVEQGMPSGLKSSVKKTADEDESSVLEARRSMMRTALARRMKQDLLESEEERLQKLQSEQFTELDHKLRLVERLRDENRVKEMQLADAIEAQQTQRFKNIQVSAAKLTKHHS